MNSSFQNPKRRVFRQPAFKVLGATFLFCAVLTSCSCSLFLKTPTDKQVHDDALADWTYHHERYLRLCSGGKPESEQCQKYRLALNELDWQRATSKAVYPIGNMPKEEKKAIAAAEKALAAMP